MSDREALSEAACEVCNKSKTGDSIDAGLILRRLLEEKGFRIVATTKEQTAPGPKPYPAHSQDKECG